MNFLNLPFFEKIEKTNNILIAGAGGGFDMFAGLPLYFALQKAGKTVYLANLSFSDLAGSNGIQLATGLFEIGPDTEGHLPYFPELHLSRWFKTQGQDVPIYCFQKTGVKPLQAAYQHLVEILELDTIILADGGTDSLMRGDEIGLGTPYEDSATIVAVDGLAIKTKLHVCLGFGIDAYHGVCHAHFLENVAALTKLGGFLGMWSLMAGMPEVELYRNAVRAVFLAMPRSPSIVNASIMAALEGQFGDYHSTDRTSGGELFINPLMTLYWTFELDKIAQQLLYRDNIKETVSFVEVIKELNKFCEGYNPIRQWKKLPM